ncbi:RluA family pseudouridine synthase [Ruminococcus sp. NK3A76]|uniref:RluA family pseudouridine synthase n=1 Tax=Ruminococcus sp. NK3A76 TaxID=877411 RepID=UPI0006912E8D|nr:RluA family pseudouridine synthase [Ruminococcus sp. NK3A76]
MLHTFKAQKPCRLSDFLARNGVSRSLLCYLKQHEGAITVNGKPAHTDYHLSPGDIAGIDEPAERSDDILPVKSDLVTVLYEDREVIVLDKPPFMPSHPSARHHDDTLANHYAYISGGGVFHCINRLDRDTSGCCLIAKSRYSAALAAKTVRKTYYAICEGDPGSEGVIEIPIRRKSGSVIERECAPDGQYAKTIFKTLKRNERYSLCEVTLETGRTHQIRVHFSHTGHPLAGDDMYGGSLLDIPRQALHCGRLKFVSPDENVDVCIEAPLPEDMLGLVKAFR